MSKVEVSVVKVLKASLCKSQVEKSTQKNAEIAKNCAIRICQECTEFEACAPTPAEIKSNDTLLEISGNHAGDKPTKCDMVGLGLQP